MNLIIEGNRDKKRDCRSDITVGLCSKNACLAWDALISKSSDIYKFIK